MCVWTGLLQHCCRRVSIQYTIYRKQQCSVNMNESNVRRVQQERAGIFEREQICSLQEEHTTVGLHRTPFISHTLIHKWMLSWRWPEHAYFPFHARFEFDATQRFREQKKTGFYWKPSKAIYGWIQPWFSCFLMIGYVQNYTWIKSLCENSRLDQSSNPVNRAMNNFYTTKPRFVCLFVCLV
jgi:hypothetical protein